MKSFKTSFLVRAAEEALNLIENVQTKWGIERTLTHLKNAITFNKTSDNSHTSCYCPVCKHDLCSDLKSFIDDVGEGPYNVVTYRCANCERLSKWNFDLYPCPVTWIEDRHLDIYERKDNTVYVAIYEKDTGTSKGCTNTNLNLDLLEKYMGRFVVCGEHITVPDVFCRWVR